MRALTEEAASDFVEPDPGHLSRGLFELLFVFDVEKKQSDKSGTKCPFSGGRQGLQKCQIS